MSVRSQLLLLLLLLIIIIIKRISSRREAEAANCKTAGSPSPPICRSAPFQAGSSISMQRRFPRPSAMDAELAAEARNLDPRPSAPHMEITLQHRVLSSFCCTSRGGWAVEALGSRLLPRPLADTRDGAPRCAADRPCRLLSAPAPGAARAGLKGRVTLPRKKRSVREGEKQHN